MGVSGLWDILRPTGEVQSLTHLAVQSGFVENRQGHRAYRIGIDASIWFFHARGGREGENPELRTLFFRCSRLLAMPFLPIFVFDGPKRPKIKRGKAIGGKEHWMVNSLRTIFDSFGFEYRTAPGEAEAELAYLNRIGIIDAILSDDVDCFLFGAPTVMRNSSATLSGNRNHGARNADGKDDGQHIYMYRLDDIASNPAVKLSPGGLILIALLRGGDYDQQGIDGCGVSTAHAVARAGYGDTLLAAARSSRPGALSAFLPAWRASLRHELSTNASGLAPRKSPTVARRITEDFPRLDVLHCYTHPITSESEGTGTRGLDSLWKKQADVAKIAHVCELYFEWGVEKTIIKRFRSFLWPGAVLRSLLQTALEKDIRNGRGVTPSKDREQEVETPSKSLARALGALALPANDDESSSTSSSSSSIKLITAIHRERRHASTDHTVEYRLEIDPRGLVARAISGIQGLRQELKDSAAAYSSDDDDDDDEDEETPKKKKQMRRADPDSKLRLWMPAVVVQYACPELVRDYVERQAKKGQKGKVSKRKGRQEKEQVDEEDEEESPPAKPLKFKTVKATKGKRRREAEKAEEEEDEDPPAKPLKFKTVKATKWKGRQEKEKEQPEEDEDESPPAKPLKFKTVKATKWKGRQEKEKEQSKEDEDESPPVKPLKFKTVKATKWKGGREKERAEEEEDEDEGPAAKPLKFKTVKATKWKGGREKEQAEEEEDEDEGPAVKTFKFKKVKDASNNAAKPKVPDTSKGVSDINSHHNKSRTKNTGHLAPGSREPNVLVSVTASGSTTSQRTRKTVTQLLDEQSSFWISTKRTSSPGTRQAHADAKERRPLIIPPRPFPLDLDNVFTEPTLATSPLSSSKRKSSFSSTASCDLVLTQEPLKRSPRRDNEHSSLLHSSPSQSPSPYRPHQMKPLHRAMARSAASNAAVDEVIVISSDDDELPPLKRKANAKPLNNNSLNIDLTASSLNHLNSEVIDLT